VKTEYNRDPFYYSADEMRVLAELAGPSVRVCAGPAARIDEIANAICHAQF
jgi:hypothetical protein